MNYIIFDLEFNQGYKNIKSNESPINSKCPFEIIQIGAVKLDKDLNPVSYLNRLVKPVLYKDIHHIVGKITNLSIEQLTDSKPFKEIYNEFIEFINKDKSILCVWGTADIRELLRNASYHQLSTLSIPKEYIDIQRYASKYFKCPKGTNIGLAKSVELLDITMIEIFHDAFNDACYTSEVFKKIYSEDIKPKIYNMNTYSRTRTRRKHTLDTANLIKEFEKIYNREISSDEISMIRLAYLMGKTNQFQVEAESQK